jgi:hypothetical protein
MSENNNERDEMLNHNPEEPKDAAPAEEPIKSIEQTVEDLKKKIQGLANEEADEPAEPKIDLGLSDEQKEKVEDFKENTMKTVNETIEDVRKKAEEFTKSSNVQKTIEYLRKNVMTAVDTAKEKFEEFRSNPEVKKTMDDAGDKLREFTEKAGDKLDDFLTDDRKNDIKKNFEKAGDAVSQSVDSASKAINEFISKPEVQETIEKTKAGAKDLAEKGTAVIKDLFDKKDGE